MAYWVQDIGSTSNKVSGTTLAYVWPKSSAAGNTIIACVLFDNAGVTLKPEASLDKPAGETASWVRLGAARSPGTTSGGASSGEMWAITTTVAWTTPTITLTLDTAVVMKAVGFSEYAGLLGPLRNTVGSAYQTGTTAASATTTGTTPVIGDLAVGFLFGSNVAAMQTGDTDTTAGAWSLRSPSDPPAAPQPPTTSASRRPRPSPLPPTRPTTTQRR